MKHTFFSISLILLSLNTFAQIKLWHWGVKSDIVKSNVDAHSSFGAEGKYGISFGGYLQRSISRDFFLKTELNYVQASFQNHNAYPRNNQLSILQPNISIGIKKEQLSLSGGLLFQKTLGYKTELPYVSGKNANGTLQFDMKEVKGLNPLDDVNISATNWGINIGTSYQLNRIGIQLTYEQLFRPSYRYSGQEFMMSWLKMGLSYRISQF